jgi:D-sedoheptulose 7-phosphate isomerase
MPSLPRSLAETSLAASAEAMSAAIALADDAAAAGQLMVDALRGGGRVLACGNGGSAADAQHLVAELVGRFVAERDGLAGIALGTDASVTTALANDYGIEQMFARQVQALGRRDDVLVALTTSGRSPNVLAAVGAARAAGLRVVGLTGASGGELVGACDVLLRAPSDVTAQVQEIHGALIHAMCAIVDDALAS